MDNEKKLWATVRRHLPGVAERIESCVSAGVPDVSGSAGGLDYWVELKVTRQSTAAVHPTALCTPIQQAWHRRRGEHGARIFVLVRAPDSLWLFAWRPRGAVYLTLMHSYGARRWDWEKFTKYIETYR